MQDRLIKGLRIGKACTLDAANEYLARVFLPMWNRRFRKDAASEVDAHRTLGPTLDLDSILSFVETRSVANDYTVSWRGGVYQIPRAAIRPGLRRSTIRVEERLNGSLWGRIGAEAVTLSVCGRASPAAELKPAAPARKDHNRGGRSQWMQGFDLSAPEAAIWKAIRGRS